MACKELDAVMTTLPFWSCSDDHVGFLVLQWCPRWFSNPAVMSTFAFWSSSAVHVGFLVLQLCPRWVSGSAVQDQEANIVITTWPESQHGYHCRIRKPTWSSLQNQEANVVITAGPESQCGNHCRTREPTWSSLQDHKVNVVITTGLESQRNHGPAMMTTLTFWSCSDNHIGFLVLHWWPRWLSGHAVISMLAFWSRSDDHVRWHSDELLCSINRILFSATCAWPRIMSNKKTGIFRWNAYFKNGSKILHKTLVYCVLKKCIVFEKTHIFRFLIKKLLL
jgi:hypothetical protein